MGERVRHLGGRVRCGEKPRTGGSGCQGEAGAGLKTSREIVSNQIITASTIKGLFSGETASRHKDEHLGASNGKDSWPDS